MEMSLQSKNSNHSSIIFMKTTKFYFILLLCGIALFTSCSTALQGIQSIPRQQQQFGKENMEFIGFKNISRNNVMLRDFGTELERSHIAINKQNFYMGIFSLQELETYKSTMRYVTFVDVIKHSYTKNDMIEHKPGLEIVGWVVAGLTCFTLFPVYLPMICSAGGNACQINLNCEYQLYVYDTVKKEVVLTTPIEIKQSDLYRGQFGHKETDKAAVNERYKNILFNTLLENYANAYNFVKNINE